MLLIMIKCLLIAYFFSRYEPIPLLIDLIPNNFIKSILTLILTCSKCCVFYTTLIYTHNFYYSVINVIIMTILERTYGKWEKRIEF